MICHKNAKDHCGRPRWGISGQVVYTPRHFDRPKTWLDSIILSENFRNLYFEVWRRSLWGRIWCEMSGEGVKLGSKSICHFWRNFDVKPGPQGSSTWDPEESWDVWPSESKIHEKNMIFVIWPEIFLVSGETLDLWNWTLVMSVWAEKGTNRKVFDRRICLWPSQIWERWFREVFGWITSRVQVVYIANLRGRWNERVASEILYRMMVSTSQTDFILISYKSTLSQKIDLISTIRMV